jgi:hypothetical protein
LNLPRDWWTEVCRVHSTLLGGSLAC